MKKALTPYKIITVLLYGEYSFVEWDKDKVTLNNIKFCRFFGMHQTRFKKHVDWLEEAGFIRKVSRPLGSTTFEVIMPQNLADMGMTISSVRGVK